MSERPENRNQVLDPARKKIIEGLRAKATTPEKVIEYTKELLNEIAREGNLSDAEKKHKIDKTIEWVLDYVQKSSKKYIHLRALQLKLNLLHFRHLFQDLKERMATIIKQKKREEEETRTERKEEKESDEKKKVEEKRRAEEQKIAEERAAAERKKKAEADSVTSMHKPKPTPEEENASDLADNFLDLNGLLCEVLQLQMQMQAGPGFSFFSEEDAGKLKTNMLELDLSKLKPEEFEKKLFELVDSVEKMFNNAKQHISGAHVPLLDICYEKISKDLMQWIGTGKLPRLTAGDKTELHQSMQTALSHPSTQQHDMTLREKAQQAVAAMRQALAVPATTAPAAPTASKAPVSPRAFATSTTPVTTAAAKATNQNPVISPVAGTELQSTDQEPPTPKKRNPLAIPTVPTRPTPYDNTK